MAALLPEEESACRENQRGCGSDSVPQQMAAVYASRNCRAQAGLQPRQIAAQFRGGRISQGAIFFQKLANNPSQFIRDFRIPLMNRLGRLIQEGIEDNRRRRAVKRQTAAPP